MRNSLRWRVILSFIGLLILSMGGLSIFITTIVPDTYLSHYTNNLYGVARILANQSKPFIQQDIRLNELSELVKLYSTQLNLRITILLPNGVVISESSSPGREIENYRKLPEVVQALQGVEGSQIRFNQSIGSNMLYVASPILDQGGVTGVIRLAVSLEPVNKSLNLIQSTILGAAIIATLIAIFLAIIVTDYTVKPLSQLTDSILNYDTRSLKQFVPSNRLDEIGQLDRAFSIMTYQLNHQIEELEQEREKISSVLSQMMDGIVIVDENGVIELINPAAQRIFGVMTENVLGKSMIEVVRNHKIFETWERCKATREQQITAFETPHRLYLQAAITPLEPAMPKSSLIVLQDLTNYRRLEIIRRDFVSNVSHELRTPLASLKALSETLMEGALEDPPAARRFLLRMEGEIDNLTQMVQELLELSRIESGRVPLKREPVSPYDLIAAPVERMALQAERGQIDLINEISEDLPNVYADKSRIGQVVINLIHNAIKFTSPGGKIVISATEESRRIVFSVSDNGSGIDPQDLARIFERFYKVDRARSGGGTGLGLSIAKHMIESHGGKIWATSQVDKGSSFYFSIPKA
jgi:two-component system phosphate regulon sensor histidine kinase PhoR